MSEFFSNPRGVQNHFRHQDVQRTHFKHAQAMIFIKLCSAEFCVEVTVYGRKLPLQVAWSGLIEKVSVEFRNSFAKMNSAVERLRKSPSSQT